VLATWWLQAKFTPPLFLAHPQLPVISLSDVRFMIQSKEGIRLPDPRGLLAAEAAKQTPNLAEINKIIWDDAVVWPVTPFTYGIWAKRDEFDFSLINLGLPPTDISWIGLRD
jgi:hypothetical protein